jgi:hypothetical protein
VDKGSMVVAKLQWAIKGRSHVGKASGRSIKHNSVDFVM